MRADGLLTSFEGPSGESGKSRLSFTVRAAAELQGRVNFLFTFPSVEWVY